MVAGCVSTVARGVGPRYARSDCPDPLLWAASLKSVTLPVALGLTEVVHTQPGLTTVCVFTTGLLGSAIGPALLSWARVRSPIARGLALGTLSHAIGTARALQEDPLSGAAGVVALTLSALLIGRRGDRLLGAGRLNRPGPSPAVSQRSKTATPCA